MMNKLIGVAASVAFLALTTNAKAVPVVIDFNGLPNNTIVDSQFFGLGVNFSNALTFAFGGTGSSSVGLVSISDGFQPQPSNPIVAIFDQSVSSVSLTGIDVGTNGFQLSAFDSVVGGFLLASNQIFGNSPAITLTVSGSGIRRVEFSQAQNISGDVTAFDNLTFESTIVSEPSTLAALGIGLFTIGALARRRRQIQTPVKAADLVGPGNAR